jgi:hypothetical protein
MTTQARSTLAVTLAAFALACADPTSSTRTLVSDGPSLAITQEVYLFNGGPGFPAGILSGRVTLCKIANEGGTFSFTVTTNGTGTLVANPSITIPAGGGEVCQYVYTSNKGINFVDEVTITEGADPTADWDLTAINTVRYLAQGPFNAGSYPAAAFNDVEDFANRKSTVLVNLDMARKVTFTNTYTAPPPVGGEGCTPGYWKQEQHFDSWPNPPYAPSNGFNATFGIGTNWFPNTFTLVQALGANGGGKNALARHAVAALLNAATGFSGFTTAQVIAAVQAAYNNASLIESNKNLFAAYNEQTCPLN